MLFKEYPYNEYHKIKSEKELKTINDKKLDNLIKEC